MPGPGTPSNRTQQVVEQLTQSILKKDFSPGTQLPPERELAQQLGVSRNVVREATKTLQSRGLLSVEHGRGTIVTGVTMGPMRQTLENALFGRQDSLLKLLQLRLPLEAEIASLAALNRRAEHLKATQKLLNEMREAASDLPYYAELDVAFHQSLAQATGNELFVLVLESLSGLLTEYRLTALRQSSWEIAQRHHERIYAAIEAGDAEAASSRMRDHLETSLQETQEIMRNIQS